MGDGVSGLGCFLKLLDYVSATWTGIAVQPEVLPQALPLLRSLPIYLRYLRYVL